MEELLSKITQLGINIDTDSLVQVARYWFWKDVWTNATIIIVLLGLGTIVYKIISNYGTSKWK